MFHALNALPIKLDPGRLDTGEGIEKTLKDTKQSTMTVVDAYSAIQNWKELKRNHEEVCRCKTHRKGLTRTTVECFLCKRQGI